MKQYKLKDRERQAALERSFEGFNEALQEAVKNANFSHCSVIEVTGDSEWWSVTIHKSEIELVDGYDPYAWNEFPEVIPPEDVEMRVEFRWNTGDIGKTCAIFYNGEWVDSSDRSLLIENVMRFRPWE